ncbi:MULTISPECIES: hypothetical protein [Pseudoalteromonas]|uniref:Uncharacterized protein n=1 Tax=Pseudoalteromonas obscura TaxID=3048491 RepID=A0ABT7ETE1_9GAMM|nr:MULTISPECIES: hypothetical protein [Pseudoalteromonas]MBQ4837108.1 hypothetical protein [Pseudoalteromonas luteoviolacea]MDK2598329.1 hypothetical protein [Pseudoalteromonas sp. P94(2023)]
MNQLIKITVAIPFIAIAFYHLYFFIKPSVTVINESDNAITEAIVRLPESRLNFGSIGRKQENTIYHSLSQNDGSYNYSFKIDGKTITGSCGYLTNNEFNKRFMITVSKRNRISCSQ